MFQEEQQPQQESAPMHIYKNYSYVNQRPAIISRSVQMDATGFLGKIHGDPPLKEITVAEGTTTIEADAFKKEKSLKTANFPKTLKKIDKSAFEDCRALTEVTLPPSVEELGDLAFMGVGSVTTINIATLKKVGAWALGYRKSNPRGPRIAPLQCGFITDVDEGNKFAFINCIERICNMRLPMGDESNITVTLRYGAGESNSIAYPMFWQTGWNLQHQGFKATVPEITYNWQGSQSNLTLMNLNGDELIIQGFFQQPSGLENLQTLVNTQHPEMAEVGWSVCPSWHNAHVKQLTCLEVIQHIFTGEYDLSEPILWVYDTPTE